MDHWNVQPDILVTAKGITSAYVPLGLCATTARIAEYFDDHYFAHGHTYEAHPMTLAPAIATIHEMQRLNLVERSSTIGQYLGEKLEGVSEEPPLHRRSSRLRVVLGRGSGEEPQTKEPLNTHGG